MQLADEFPLCILFNGIGFSCAEKMEKRRTYRLFFILKETNHVRENFSSYQVNREMEKENGGEVLTLGIGAGFGTAAACGFRNMDSVRLGVEAETKKNIVATILYMLD